MTDGRRSRYLFSVGRVVLIAALAVLVASGSSDAAPPITLQVAISDTLPGFPRSDLSRHLAHQMAEAQLPDWRFAPAAENATAPDRVEWSFKLNPYAGGGVRNLARSRSTERASGVHRPITIEVRLYLNGDYQTLVEKQAVIESAQYDPELAAAVASVTQNLLGPLGAYRAIDIATRRTHGPR